jgi:hypothetical protein
MTPLVQIALAFPFGILTGLAHFKALRTGTSALAEGATGRALGLTALRLALTIGFLVAAALTGAPALLSGAAGIALGRAAVLRRARAAR